MKRGKMFRRKRKPKPLTEKEIDHVIAISEDQKYESSKELETARETVSILNRIREENHIVHDLREVFGGH